MPIRLTEETERIIEEEIRNGHFASADDLVRESVDAWHAKNQQTMPATVEERRETVERIRALRSGARLERNGISLREFAHLGHRH